MGPSVTAGIPHLSDLCLNKLADTFREMCGNLFSCIMLQKSLNAYVNTYIEMCRNQFRCCKLEKSFNTYTEINRNTIFSSVGSSSDTVLYLYMLSQPDLSGGSVYALVEDSIWSKIFHVLFMIERMNVINVALKLYGALVCQNYCRYSNSLHKPGSREKMEADVWEDTKDNVDRSEITSGKVSTDKGSASFIVSDDFSTDCKGSENQDGDEVTTSENVVEDIKQTTENESEVSMFDVSYLNSSDGKLETGQDVSTSDVLLDRKQCGKEIDNKAQVMEVDSLNSKKYESEDKGDMVIDDNMNADISLLKGSENIMLQTIHQDVFVTYHQLLMKSYNQMLKYETFFKSVTASKQNFTQEMDVILHIYDVDCSDNKSATAVHSGFGFKTGLRLSSRQHVVLPLVQKLCHLYDLLQVCSLSDYRSQVLIGEFMHDDDCCYFIINITRTKRTDSARIKRINILRISKTEMRRINTNGIEVVKGIDIARITGIHIARINNSDNRKLIICDNRIIAAVHLISSNDLHICPPANKTKILSYPVSLLLPGSTAKTFETRLEKQCGIHHKKNVNNCQMASQSLDIGSVTHTAKSATGLSNTEEASSVCKSGSNQQIRFHADKPDLVEAQMSHENTDHVLFSIKPLSGKRLSVLLKNQQGRNVEGERRSSSLDVLESITLKKLRLQIQNEILDCFTPSQALRNICVNMLPPVCGIPWKEFERETMRLASFAKYPASAAKSAANLASSGFVYVGNGTSDRVKCYFCSVEKESWEMNDNIDDIHKTLSPSCPMVIVQFSNNVASNISSPNLGNARGYSSSGTYTSESLQPVSVGNSVSSSQSTSSANGRSGYDDVDYRRTNANSQPTTETARHQSSSSQRAAAITSSLLADANGSINTSRASTHTPVLPVLEMLQQDSSSAVRNNMINHGSQHSHNSDSLNIESIRNLQNSSSTHPNINTQVYAIPPGSNGMTVADTSNSAPSQSQLTYQLLGIFHERPKFPNYAVLARRLQSFDGWPEHHPIKKEDLVKSGLFFAGYGDCCKCFFCGGGLRNWESGDNAYVEHARWFDKCSYIRQFMGLEFVEAVQCLKNRGGTITFKDVTDYMQTKGQSTQNLFNDRKISDDVAVRSLVDAGYNLEDVSRAALSLRESGELLSADVILRKMRDQQSEVNGATAEGGAASDTTNPDDVPDEGRLQALKEQNYALRSNLTCKICMDKEVKIVFLPCGHLISCQECAVALQDCPLCRSHIRARARANIN